MTGTSSEAAAALVTGGGSGIGAACVRALSESGIAVAVLDVQPAPGADWSARLDVRDQASVIESVRRVEVELGAVEYLVTAAGAYSPAPIETLELGSWHQMLELHVGGTVNAWRAVLPGMLARGRGSICAIGSELGLIGDPDAPHYAAAKAALHAMVKCLALEVAPKGVRVNCVAPGPTDTPLLKADPHVSRYASSLPLKRVLSADEVAAAVRFTLVEDTNLVGQVLSPNAGAVL